MTEDSSASSSIQPAGQTAGSNGTGAAPPAEATASLFVPSAPVPDSYEQVRGPDFDQPQDVESLISAFGRVGFQASGVNKAVEIIEQMVSDSGLGSSHPVPKAALTLALSLCSADGGCQTSLYWPQIQTTFNQSLLAPKSNATSFWASHPI